MTEEWAERLGCILAAPLIIVENLLGCLFTIGMIAVGLMVLKGCAEMVL